MRKRAQLSSSDDLLIKPTSDLFTAVLWSAPKNEPLLRDFLNAVLIDARQPPIQEATVLNPFNIKEFAKDRQLVLDVRVRDEVRRWYNIEVQTASHSGFCDRMLLHWAATYSALLRTGDDFRDLVPVKGVIITDFPIFSELRNLHTVFEIRARENPGVLLSDHFQMHFLRLGDMRKRKMEGLTDLYGGVQHWANFFTFGSTTTEDKMSQLVENNPAVMAAYREFRRFTTNPEMQEAARLHQRDIDDWRITVGAALKEGEAKGIVKGEAKRNIEIARKMKNEGIDDAIITKVTGLSLQVIERLD